VTGENLASLRRAAQVRSLLRFTYMRNGTGAVITAMVICGIAACGEAKRDPGYDPASGTQGLTLAPGVTVDNGSYAVSGPDGFATAGSVSIGDSADLSITLPGLPIGTGYQIDVSATASDGVTSCDGSATFDVVGDPTTVSVHLTCAIPTGDVQVSGSVNVCPVLDGVNVVPMKAQIGGAISLAAAAHDPDNGPSPLTFAWQINGAQLSNHPEPTLSFTCTAEGTNVVQVTVSDGDPNPACADTATVTLTCGGP
jgi:hypothetical protein